MYEPTDAEMIEALHAVNNELGRRLKREWISVDERLPENTNEVLVCDAYDHCVAWLRLSDKKWILKIDVIEINGDAWAELDLDVTHWMPLPPLPE